MLDSLRRRSGHGRAARTRLSLLKGRWARTRVTETHGPGREMRSRSTEDPHHDAHLVNRVLARSGCRGKLGLAWPAETDVTSRRHTDGAESQLQECAFFNTRQADGLSVLACLSALLLYFHVKHGSIDAIHVETLRYRCDSIGVCHSQKYRSFGRGLREEPSGNQLPNCSCPRLGLFAYLHLLLQSAIHCLRRCT